MSDEKEYDIMALNKGEWHGFVRRYVVSHAQRMNFTDKKPQWRSVMLLKSSMAFFG